MRRAGGRGRPSLAGRPAAVPARGPRAVVYLVGGTAVSVAAVAGALPLGRVPLAVGACLLLTALSCGRDDGPWGAGLVTSLVGLGVLAADRGWAGVDVSSSVGAAAGGCVGLLLVLLLEARGVAVGLVATAAAVAATVAVLAVRRDVDALGRPVTWGVVLLLLGATNLLLWARDREVGLTGPRP